ncbi:AAA family ATPase [Paenarthrobacter aromaticivorans]|uniref:AAA family ATPase n=1 Tax=Paenarthrobacter aromaticivorans TaxID=2849150 RepID=A0ABS6I6C6_9MICC|nr:AAA family ATPase [Paenarthrobacter sp. MMS21-TAE1-1]MBU8867270.1 AAA family ATPase [Paenarthrobacter sp. MMS21-TAE1-1]
MIKTLAIANYRSIRDLAVELHGLDVVTGANGSGKSSLYRALRLLAECAGGDSGNVVGSLARDGGLASTLWAGPESISEAMRRGEVPVQGTVRRDSVNLKLGYSGDDFGYLVDLGMPVSSGAGFDQETGRPRPSAFSLDPEIKREQIFSGPVARPGSLLVDRKGSLAKLRGADGDWTELSRRLDTFQSMLTEVSDQDRAPEVLRVRDSVRSWRFYDHFRTDAEAPARQAQLGTRTPVLHHSGKDLAAALQTLREVGFERQLDAAVDHAFPGSRLEIAVSDGRFSVELRQPGMLRPMKASELSDGTLRFLLLTAALLTPRPPELMVLNEPETSLHVDLMPALAGLIVQASANSQMIVVTHSEALLSALRESGAAHEHELYKDLGETRIKGLGSLEGPLWSWPKR